MKTKILSPEADAAARVERLRLEDVEMALSRLTAIVPHLEFEGWWLGNKTKEELTESSGGKWVHYDKNGGSYCYLFVRRIGFSAWLKARSGKVVDEDINFLDRILKEVSSLFDAAVDVRMLPLDFGVHAVSGLLEDISGIQAEKISSCIKSLRLMSRETYENQRLSYGLVLRKKKMRAATAAPEFGNKRFKRLTDGLLTALALDCEGKIMELLSLDPDGGKEISKRVRPWWLSALADTSAREDGIGIALTRNGDVLIVYQQELLLSQRSGEWRIWRHNDIISIIQNSWRPQGSRGDLDRIIEKLYMVALDLSFRGSGGLLVVVESQERVLKLVNSKSDQIGADSRSEAEKALDESVSSKSVLEIDRRVLGDLACLDGAVVVDRNGRIFAYGAMVRSKKGIDEQGSRTRAAIGASEFGLAIKISMDGEIAFYLYYDKILSL